MILELQNTLAQDGYLYLWRTGVGIVDSKLCNRLCLRISRQCHSRIDTPRLFLIFLYGNRIAHWRPDRAVGGIPNVLCLCARCFFFQEPSNDNAIEGSCCGVSDQLPEVDPLTL